MDRAAGVACCGIFVVYVDATAAAADVWNKASPVSGAAQIAVNADEGNTNVVKR
jgi:hypothetical protein